MFCQLYFLPIKVSPVKMITGIVVAIFSVFGSFQNHILLLHLQSGGAPCPNSKYYSKEEHETFMLETPFGIYHLAFNRITIFNACFWQKLISL